MKMLKDKKNLFVLSGGIFFIIIIIVILIKIIIGNITFLEPKVNISLSSAETIKLVNYEHENFTMQIPSGWQVVTAGDNMYFSIRVYDPNDEKYQIFVILEAAPLLKNNQAKSWYENYYKLFGGEGNKSLAKAIVLPKATVESFYYNFNEYINYAKEMGSTFKAPDLTKFEVVESFENNSPLKSIAMDDKIIRGTFQDSKTQTNGEGLFMATIINTGSNNMLGYDTLFYVAYNVMGITTGEYELINYQDILTKSLKSLQYKDSFVNTTIKNIEKETKTALNLNSYIQQSYDSYNSAWSARQKTYDITSQKYSDATLGYERVYDTNTGNVYKAYNGFVDDYNGNRYKSITNDMYSKSISGYIEK